MINERMLNVLQYMKKHQTTSYKEIAQSLDIKERSVRYDIDRINESLSMKGLPMIEKRSKGQLIFPEELDLGQLGGKADFIYTSEQRKDLMILVLLLDEKKFKLNYLSKQFQVSRSTVKNDLNELTAELEKKGLMIEYTHRFSLKGPRNQQILLLTNEFIKYVNLLINPPARFNPFEFYSLNTIQSAFQNFSINEVIICIDEFLEKNHYVLTDDSYKWYIANVMVVIWFLIRKEEHPLEKIQDEIAALQYLDEFQQELSRIVGIQLEDRQMGAIVGLLEYTNRYSHMKEHFFDPLYAEEVVYELISRVGKALKIPFEKDTILVEGLLKHTIPLLERIQNGIQVTEDMDSVLGDEEREMHGMIQEVCSQIDPLDQIKSRSEIVYLTIYFLASMKRMQSTPYKRVLLVCGHGYGTTTMLRETLTSEYQVHVVDTIPVYRIPSYVGWSLVDCVLSTTEIHANLPKPAVLVNPILKAEDYSKIESLGIARKRILSNVYAIEDKLDFLNSQDKAKVIAVLEKELGYQSITAKVKKKAFTKLVRYDSIQMLDHPLEWRDSVRLALKPLKERGTVQQSYEDNIIETLEEIGFYSISDDSFALLHGKLKEGVTENGIGLLINKTPVEFGDKKVKILFCLAAKDSKSHIPAVVTLMRMIKLTGLISKLEACVSRTEAYQILLDSEFEVS